MEKYQYLIIGGGAAGTAAAETIRQNDTSAAIAIVSDEVHPLYSRVMLSKPNFFLGKIPFDKVFMKGQEWYADNKINFIGGKKAIKLDAAQKILSLSDGSKLGYEKLLIATGVNARVSTVSGAEKKGVHYLRTLEDGRAIMEHIKTAKSAVTVGGGFISFEMADLLKLAGLDTTVLIREKYFWEPILDEASGKMIEKAMESAGVKIIRNAEIAEIIGNESVEGVVLKDGTKISCEMVMCGIGVTCPIDWIKENGIATGRGILANEYLQTNIPNVWTAGDIAEYKDLLLEESTIMGNWVNAREQGRIAGLNMMGKREPFKFVSFYTTSGFGINIAFVGDVAPTSDRTVIARGSPKVNSYARLIVDAKGELVGATLLNRSAEMSSISKLIGKNVNVSGYTAELADPNFDLSKFLV